MPAAPAGQQGLGFGLAPHPSELVDLGPVEPTDDLGQEFVGLTPGMPGERLPGLLARGFLNDRTHCAPLSVAALMVSSALAARQRCPVAPTDLPSQSVDG
jgi:hypothetical protein